MTGLDRVTSAPLGVLAFGLLLLAAVAWVRWRDRREQAKRRRDYGHDRPGVGG